MCIWVQTLFCSADQRVKVLVGSFVVGLHLQPVFSSEHLRVLAVSQEFLVVLLQVPQSQSVLLHSQGLELHEEQNHEPQSCDGTQMWVH